MKKAFITIISTFGFLFVLWIFIIAIKNNFNTTNIRFSLRMTFQQLTQIQTANFEELVRNIEISLKSYQAIQEASQNNIWLQITASTSWLGTLGIIFIAGVKYSIGLSELIILIIQFIFNPITY